MKLKKFALRGLVILMVVVALCIFFARTVQTITTPKVQLVSPQTGRLEISRGRSISRRRRSSW